MDKQPRVSADLVKRIPSTQEIRQRLADLLQEVRLLRHLLKAADQRERLRKGSHE